MTQPTDNIRALRPVPESIPWYIRVGHNDHTMLESKLSTGDSRISRVVIDAAHLERHESIIRALQARQAELVLDTRVAELATPSSGKNSLRKLPWWKEATEVRPGRYHDAEIQVIAGSIAKTTIDHGFTAVLAPTHYLGTDSEQWVDVDAALTHRLRQELDRLGGTAIRIYYPLLIPYAWLSIASRMRLLDGVLSTLPIDAATLVCTNKQCCPRGLKDMFSHSRNHVINARFDQLTTLTQSTEMLRSDTFIRRALIPAGASLMKLDHALAGFPDLQKRIQKKRRFVDDLRSTLEDLVNRTSTEVRRSPIPRRAAFRQFAVVRQNNPRPNL